MSMTIRHCTLREARREKGWTQHDLAVRSGIDQRNISKLERYDRNPRNNTVIKLETALGLKRGTLIFGAEQQDGAAA